MEIQIYTRLKKISALMISDDITLQNKMRSKFKLFKNLFITNSENFLNFYLNCNTNIDIIVVDLDLNEELNLFAILSIQPRQQFVFLAKNRRSYTTLLRKFRGGSSAILFKPVRFSAILDNIELLFSQNSSQILHLNKNIKIDLLKEQIFDGQNQLFLTNMMHKLILVLSSNANSLTTFEMIEESVYGGESPSKIAMQNLLGALKRKLDLDIKNVFSRGYILYTI